MSRRGKGLSEQDRALWNRVARTANPLPGRMASLLEAQADQETPPAPERGPAKSKPPVEPQQEKGLSRAVRAALAARFANGASAGNASHHPKDLPGNNRPSRSPHPIERPVHKKLSKGRLKLDARIDLHGLDLARAHDELLSFLSLARVSGQRHVLVITGKGASFGSEGAIKRAVPQWLAKPAFAILISGYETAGRGHGGEGALYIRLRKPAGMP